MTIANFDEKNGGDEDVDVENRGWRTMMDMVVVEEEDGEDPDSGIKEEGQEGYFTNCKERRDGEALGSGCRLFKFFILFDFLKVI